MSGARIANIGMAMITNASSRQDGFFVMLIGIAPTGKGGGVGMNAQIYECHRKNRCVDCDDEKCWHAGELIADCPFWKCKRKGDLFEDCESCEFLKQIHVEGR